MSDLVKHLQEMAGSISYGSEPSRVMAEAAAEITRLQKELETATGYAERLAVVLMEKHFPEATTWKPLSGDLVGILTQIDNLTTGLCRATGGRE